MPVISFHEGDFSAKAIQNSADHVVGEAHGDALKFATVHANDLLYADGKAMWFEGKRINNPNTHGTGCTLSSAIASNLAKGFALAESVRRSKDYISAALAAMLDLGKGSGPMNHAFDLQGEYARGMMTC